jgi:hypothetical protein
MPDDALILLRAGSQLLLGNRTEGSGVTRRIAI